MSTQLSNQCKTSLYRIFFEKPRDAGECVVFFMADSRDAASRKASKALAVIFDISDADVCVYNLASFADMVDCGVSDDEDARVFEIGWKGADVSLWAEHPMFFTDDTSLLWKWAELCSDLAEKTARDAITRARS